jgi:hypothetical protein
MYSLCYNNDTKHIHNTLNSVEVIIEPLTTCVCSNPLVATISAASVLKKGGEIENSFCKDLKLDSVLPSN